jgi:hypothetical protein
VGLTEQPTDLLRDGVGHVNGGRNAVGRPLAEPGHELWQRALVAEAAAADVGESDRPAHDLFPPSRLVWSVGEDNRHQNARLVDNPTPQPSAEAGSWTTPNGPSAARSASPHAGQEEDVIDAEFEAKR